MANTQISQSLKPSRFDSPGHYVRSLVRRKQNPMLPSRPGSDGFEKLESVVRSRLPRAKIPKTTHSRHVKFRELVLVKGLLPKVDFGTSSPRKLPDASELSRDNSSLTPNGTSIPSLADEPHEEWPPARKTSRSRNTSLSIQLASVRAPVGQLSSDGDSSNKKIKLISHEEIPDEGSVAYNPCQHEDVQGASVQDINGMARSSYESGEIDFCKEGTVPSQSSPLLSECRQTCMSQSLGIPSPLQQGRMTGGERYTSTPGSSGIVPPLSPEPRIMDSESLELGGEHLFIARLPISPSLSEDAIIENKHTGASVTRESMPMCERDISPSLDSVAPCHDDFTDDPSEENEEGWSLSTGEPSRYFWHGKGSTRRLTPQRCSIEVFATDAVVPPTSPSM